MAEHTKTWPPGRSAPGKRKIGGDLQGEPIFRLPGPVRALGVASKAGEAQPETEGDGGDITDAANPVLASNQRVTADWRAA